MNIRYLKGILEITKNTPNGIFFLTFPSSSEVLETKGIFRRGWVVCHVINLLRRQFRTRSPVTKYNCSLRSNSTKRARPRLARFAVSVFRVLSQKEIKKAQCHALGLCVCCSGDAPRTSSNCRNFFSFLGLAP